MSLKFKSAHIENRDHALKIDDNLYKSSNIWDHTLVT